MGRAGRAEERAGDVTGRARGRQWHGRGTARRARLGWWAAVAVLLAGCSLRPSGVVDEGEAPTGVASGVTLYFVDTAGELRPQLRRTGRLGTVHEAVTLLLEGPGGSGMRTRIATTDVTRVAVTATDGTIELLVPLAAADVTPLGIDQIVCTALAAHVQAGGARGTAVRIRFTLPGPGSDARRTCPLTG
jgi:hypothetical protein